MLYTNRLTHFTKRAFIACLFAVGLNPQIALSHNVLSEQQELQYKLNAINATLKSIIADLIKLDSNNNIVEYLATSCLSIVPSLIQRVAIITDNADKESVIYQISNLLKLEEVIPVMHANCVILERQHELAYNAIKKQHQSILRGLIGDNTTWKKNLGDKELQKVKELETAIKALNKFKWRLYLLQRIRQTADAISNINIAKVTAGAGIATGLYLLYKNSK
jgi:hypothetical protein